MELNVIDIPEEHGDSTELEVSPGVGADISDNKPVKNLLMASFKQELLPFRDQLRPTQCCIFRVPSWIREVNEDAFTPKIISIGPFHRGKPSFQAMEDTKKLYTLKLINYMPREYFEKMVDEIKKLEGDARACYAEPINMPSDEFVKMMVYDGCFMIAYILMEKDCYDPIFITHGMSDIIRRDMLLIENQLPFVILERLYEIASPHTSPNLAFTDIVMTVLRLVNIRALSGVKHKHFLDCLRNHQLQHYKMDEGPSYCVTIPCASDLQASGVKFKKRNRSNIFQITFYNGVFEIPPIPILFTAVEEAIYRNFIAFEQCDKNCECLFTSYFGLLDDLIRTETDMKLLYYHGIIQNYLGDHEKFALFFNNYKLEFFGDYYGGLRKKVMQYYEIKLNGRTSHLIDIANFQEDDEESRELIRSIINEVQNRPRLQQCCIYRVPSYFRESNEDAYSPMVVSIGPLHHGKPSLQAMEEHKIRFFYELMSRTSYSFLEDMVKAIQKLEGNARACYSESINMSHDDFVKMMLYDSCFLIQLLSKLHLLSTSKDPLSEETLNYVRFDVLKLENQLPFIVLKRVFAIVEDKLVEKSNWNFNMFIKLLSIRDDSKSFPDSKDEHALGLLRNHYLQHTEQNNIYFNGALPSIPTATELAESGIKFKKSDVGGCKIIFKDGVIEISIIRFENSDISIYRNIIAFEQCHRGCKSSFSCYVGMLDSLINTEKDVKLLCDKGIIMGSLGSNEQLANHVNTLFTDVFVAEHPYGTFCDEVNAFHKKKYHRWRATLMRDYFSSPWKIIQLVAATILLVLTFLQTLYSVK